MARARTQRAAAVGVAEHGNSAVLVTVTPGGELLDLAYTDGVTACPGRDLVHFGRELFRILKV